jgi:Fur family ferric uptake transcriptional regulator
VPEGLRPTRQRVAVLEAVERLGVFVSAQAVHEDLVRERRGVGLYTVYRSLHALAERGALDAVRGPEGEMLYRRCDSHPAHGHVVCRVCGTAVEIAAGSLHHAVEESAQRAGFVEVDLVVKAFGVCAECSGAPRCRQ